MKKMRLKSWVITMLMTWFALDFFLVALALYMQRIYELGL